MFPEFIFIFGSLLDNNSFLLLLFGNILNSFFLLFFVNLYIIYFILSYIIFRNLFDSDGFLLFIGSLLNSNLFLVLFGSLLGSFYFFVGAFGGILDFNFLMFGVNSRAII